MHGEVISRIS